MEYIKCQSSRHNGVGLSILTLIQQQRQYDRATDRLCATSGIDEWLGAWLYFFVTSHGRKSNLLMGFCPIWTGDTGFDIVVKVIYY